MEAGVRVVSLPRLRSLFFFRQGVTESLYQISRAYLLVIPPILTKTLRRQGMLEASPRPVKPQKARRPRDADSMKSSAGEDAETVPRLSEKANKTGSDRKV